MPGRPLALAAAAAAATAAIATAVLAAGCARNVPQDRATGPDGKLKGARPIVLENGEARVRGVVTYPGGDRVDWRRIELPKDIAGDLSLRLSWRAPRPGLGLGLDVFDVYGRQVASSRSARTRTRTSRRTRKAEIAGAKGAYFVRVYAPERGDAGAYTLSVAFAAVAVGGPPVDPTTIPDPPRLPAVPLAPVPCDPHNWDKNNRECDSVCPIPARRELKQCMNVCPDPPTVDVKACWDKMECPTVPDRRIKKCEGMIPTCAPGMPASNTCLPPPPPKPVRARVVNVSQVGAKVEVRLDRGTQAGVTKGWRGRLLGKNGRPIPQSDFVVSRVGDRVAYGMINLRSDAVTANLTAELSPPP